MPKTIDRYGAKWPVNWDVPELDLRIEMACIERNGKWKSSSGAQCGLGLFHHYKRFQEIVWPKDYHHRWTDLELSEILNNTITVILGPKDSGKTHVALVRYGLTDYFCFPNNTLIIISSTTLPALEGRVWGDMKNMFEKARERFDFLAGNVLESKHAIVTDDLNDECVIVRDMRKGILCLPCKTSAVAFTNISSYVGMKQERRRHLGDEFQFMSGAMMDSISNMNSGDYKGVFVGNPLGQDDPLDKMSEPECGWESLPEPTKTTTWKNRRFLNSRTICLFGPDSPNFDDPEHPNKYKGLLNSDGIQRVVAGYGKDSHQYYSQCLGVRKVGLNARRVITKDLCRRFGAFDDVDWEGGERVKIAGLDAAYGGVGGDRAIGGHIEFGRAVGKGLVIACYPPLLVPVNIKREDSPEDQLALWCKHYCEANNISPENFFYDSTGRGSLGPALARIWSAKINPVEFGGSATERPVSLDMFIYDEKKNTRRLKTCKEEYSKFVTELWWTSRRAIESSQIRRLPEIVCEEGCAREWKQVAGSRIEIETKAEMKERTGYSPDYYDWFVTCIEGARRRGFVISKLGNAQETTRSLSWLDEQYLKERKLLKSKELTFA